MIKILNSYAIPQFVELEVDGVPGKFYTPFGLESLLLIVETDADRRVVNEAHRLITNNDIQGYTQQELFR